MLYQPALFVIYSVSRRDIKRVCVLCRNVRSASNNAYKPD